MELQDSCSMTPPLSPMGFGLMEEEPPDIIQRNQNENGAVSDQAVVFVCNGEDRLGNHSNLHPCGPLLSGSVHRLISKDELTAPGILHGVNTCVLFGYYFTPQMALKEQTLKLFQFAKQWIDKIELFSGTSLTRDQSDDLLKTRRELKDFLDYVGMFIVSHIPVEENQYFLSEITTQLHGLLLYVGRLSDHLSFTGGGTSGSKIQTKASHHFHMHLDIYLGILQILIKIDQLTAGSCLPVTICDNRSEGNSVQSLSSQLTQLILWDVVTVCADRYQKMSAVDHLRLSACPCTCVKEFIVIVIHLLSWRQASGNGQDFWFAFHDVIQDLLNNPKDNSPNMEIDSNVFYNPPMITVNKPAALGLWLLVQIAPLFAYDAKGQFTKQAAPTSNYPLAQKLVKSCLAMTNADESQLQNCLRCCVKLSHLWEPDVTIVMTLWDYFSGKLNNNFHVASLGIQGLASVRKTAVSLLAECRMLTQRDVMLSKLDQENSFSLFLHILSDHLQRFLHRGSTQEWRQLKGRIFSKFHTRRMQELSETGLNNLTKLFITLILAVQTDLDVVVGKLCDLFELLDFSILDVRRRSSVWKGMFSLIVIYLEKKQDVSFLAEKMSAGLNACCSEYCEEHMDSMKKQKMWALLSFYFDNLSDIFDQSSHQSLSQHKLIGENISQVLPVCGENELHHILSTCLSILTNVRTVFSSHDRDVAILNGARAWVDVLWQAVFPFCKVHATTQTPPPELADLVACLCMLAAQIGEDKQSVCSTFQYFALNEDVNIRCSCRFLDHVLQSPPVLQCLSVTLPDYQTSVIQTWLRCVLLSSPSSQECLNINRILCQMSEVKAIFQKAEMVLPAVTQTSLLQFFKALGQCYHKSESLMNKITYRNKACSYCRDLIRYVTPILRNHGPSETLSSVYNITGYLVKYCAPLLYVRSQPDCPLPSIIDRLVLPHSLFDHRKTVHPTVLTAIREHLHLFVQGLSQLDYRRDPYIQRRVKDIIVQFLQRFPTKPSSSHTLGSAQTVHPLVACLGKALSKSPNEESSKFRQFILSLVVENFLKVTSMILPPNAVTGLSYITEVFKRTMSAEEITRDAVSLFEVLLEIGLIAENPGIREHVNALLQILLETCAKRSDRNLILSLVSPVQRFVDKYIRLNASNVLEVSLEKAAVTYPDLVSELVPFLTETVLAIERKRGVGKDKQLRSSYMKLLSHLGSRGSEEVLRLENTDSHDDT